MSKPELRIGTSGYQYDHWKGIFYPAGLPKKSWFGHFATHFNTVEINNTFYHLPEAETFDNWRQQAPPGFLYVLKFSRYGSHMTKLKNPGDSVGRFLERADRLGRFLGPILVQLPPRWHVNPERLADFLQTAPSDHRWAVEFRDESWLCEPVYEVLRRYNAALCIHDLIKDHPEIRTTNWVYLRFHGGPGHGGNYSRARLAAEAGRIRRFISDNLDVFAYFNNDVGGHAIDNAKELRRLVLKTGPFTP